MPHEYPQIQANKFNIPLDESQSVILRPRMIKSEEKLRDYPVSDRKCHFSDEVRLKYFMSYTKRHCELECAVDLVLKHCGCFLHYIQSELINWNEK
jgi:Amiloride-sensitive sodium channel